MSRPLSFRGDAALVLAGVVLATASGVAAWRAAGPYADSAITTGLWSTTDPDTGDRLLYRDVHRPDGTVLRYLFSTSNRQLRQVQVMRMVNGTLTTVNLDMDSRGLKGIVAGDRSVAREGAGGSKVGFSLRGNGVIDAWAFRDAAGQLVRIEVSRRQTDLVDRWEYYQDGQLARVEEDDNLDGKPDRRLTYEAGILVSEVPIR